MSEIEYCEKCGYIVQQCQCEKPMTNGDRIRNMSDEELAIFLEAIKCNSHGWCEDCGTLKGEPCNGFKDESNSLVKERLDWLKEEVEEDD